MCAIMSIVLFYL